MGLLVWIAGFCKWWRRGRWCDGCSWCRVLFSGHFLASLPLLLAREDLHRLGVELDGYTRRFCRCSAGSIAPGILLVSPRLRVARLILQTFDGASL